MKDVKLLPVLIGILAGVALAWAVINGVERYRAAEQDRCDAAFAVMGGTKSCMDTPGCFYTAPDLVDAHDSAQYYVAHCEANERAE